MVPMMFLALGLVVTLCWPSVGQETAAEQAPARPLCWNSTSNRSPDAG